MRLLAPPGIGALLAEHVGLTTEPLKSGTIGPAATAGLAAAGDIDAMIAFSDPIELRPGRHHDPLADPAGRLLGHPDRRQPGHRRPAAGDRHGGPPAAAGRPVGDRGPDEPGPARGAVQLWTVRATVDDVPGRLAILAASLARRAINILSVQVHLTPDGPVDELLVAASPVLSAADLTAAVTDGGARSPAGRAGRRARARRRADPGAEPGHPAGPHPGGPADGADQPAARGAELTWHAEPPEGHGGPVPVTPPRPRCGWPTRPAAASC